MISDRHTERGERRNERLEVLSVLPFGNLCELCVKNNVYNFINKEKGQDVRTH
jgi:hypothetical protein